MRAAHAEPDTEGRNRATLQTEGKIERAAGWATGCGGMCLNNIILLHN